MAKLPRMNVIGVQFDIAWENKQANFEKVRRLLSEEAPERDSLVVLPELFATGFTMNAAMAEEYGGETELFLAQTAQEFGVCVLGGVAVRGRDGRMRNKALAFGPSGELLAFYAKRQPFTLGGERQHYVAGEKLSAFHWAGCMIAPFICYDLRFPELFRKVAAAHRPELFAVIANWPEKRIHHWTRLLQARAIENQAFVIGVNRTGRDPNHQYPGHSAILDQHGELLQEMVASEGCVRASLDFPALRNYRRELPFLDDLRL